MSRLDDQLREAFRREPPSADFTARVLERVAARPASRLSWWRRLAALLEPPKLRWVAIGATAALLLAIGAAQYGRLRQEAFKGDPQVAGAVSPSQEGGKSTVSPERGDRPDETGLLAPKLQRSPNRRLHPASHRTDIAQGRKRQELKTEEEAAKEKLMLALHIASATLNEAQKAVHDDGERP